MSPTLLQTRMTRVPFVRPICLVPLDGSGPGQRLLASNISVGGLFVRTSEPYAVGTRLKLEMESRGQRLPFSEVEVVWQRPVDLMDMSGGDLPGCGLRFVDPSPSSRALVEHVVERGGTGRGQARTPPAGTPSLEMPALREPIHAPSGPIQHFLTSPPDEPTSATFDAASIRPTGENATLASYRRRGDSHLVAFVAGLLLVASVGAGGLWAWQGLTAEPTPAPSVPRSPPAVLAEVVAPKSMASQPTPASREASPAPKPPEKGLEARVAEPPQPQANEVKAAMASPGSPRADPPAVKETPVASDQRLDSPATIALPSGAARSVEIVSSPGEVAITPGLAPGSHVEKVFTLSSPPRLVIDVNGGAPKGAPRVEGRSGILAVRLGVRPGGTRLVLDLARSWSQVHQESNGRIVLK